MGRCNASLFRGAEANIYCLLTDGHLGGHSFPTSDIHATEAAKAVRGELDFVIRILRAKAQDEMAKGNANAVSALTQVASDLSARMSVLA